MNEVNFNPNTGELSNNSYCNKCGKQIPFDSQFCNYCGVEQISKSGSNNNLLFEAIVNDDINIVKQQIRSGIDLNKKGCEGVLISPLHMSVIYHRFDIAIELINSGANCNEITDDGIPIYELLCFQMDIAFLGFMLSNGLNPNLKDQFGESILIRFIDFPDQVKELIDAGANVNEVDHNGNSILCAAITVGNLELIKYLISAGANVNQKSLPDGISPLKYALDSNRRIEIINELINAGANVNEKIDGFSILDIENLKGRIVYNQILINAGAY